jgi:hypothetical protein
MLEKRELESNKHSVNREAEIRIQETMGNQPGRKLCIIDTRHQIRQLYAGEGSVAHQTKLKQLKTEPVSVDSTVIESMQGRM